MSKQESEILRGTPEGAKNIKCRIPQPFPSGCQRRPLYSPKAAPPHIRFPKKPFRPSSAKRPPVSSKRATTDIVKSSKNIIMVPVTQKQHTKTVYTNKQAMTCLPSQETICRSEYLELQNEAKEEADSNKKENLTSQNDKVTFLKLCWQDDILRFEKLKEELNEKQKAIIELYARMSNTHKKMSALGHQKTLPSPNELHMMKVTNLTTEQLLQHQSSDGHLFHDHPPTVPDSIDNIFKTPSKLIHVCEQILTKNNEIFHEVEAIVFTTREDKMKSQLKKVLEFNTENKRLSGICEIVKNEYAAETTDIASVIRKCIEETTVLQTSNKKLKCNISKLQSERDDVIKQLQEANTRKPNVNYNKIKEMEKLLKEEKYKYAVLKDRFCRASEQARVNNEQASQLDAALEQSRSNCRTLERTVQQLKEENQKMHNDFATELNKFSDSITENSSHLQEIAEARDKLDAEKEDLENRLSELSAHYNESMKNMKAEINSHVAKVIEIEKKYTEEKDERLKLLDKVESLCAQLCEAETRYKNLCLQLQERDIQINKCTQLQTELETTENQLNTANAEIEKYRDMFARQNEVIKEIELNLKQSVSSEESMKNVLTNTKEYTTQLEKKIALLEQQLQSSEYIRNSYEAQLSSFKRHLSQIQDFGEFENFNELIEMIDQQQIKLHDTIKQNAELAKAIQKKDSEADQYIENITKQEQAIEQRDGIIKMLSDKEDECTNTIKLLRNKIEMRTQADIDVNQQIFEKNAEIDSLLKNLDTKEDQINQLEKIIITIEDQAHKASSRRKKYQENIKYLENKLAKYEAFCDGNNHSIDAPTDDLDNIIRILEEELNTPVNANMKYIENISDKQNNLFEKILNNSSEKPIKIKDPVDRTNNTTHTQKWVPEHVCGNSSETINEISKDKKCEIYLTRNVNFTTPIQLRNNKMFKIARHKI